MALRIRDVMSTPVRRVPPSAGLREAARVMREFRIGSVVRDDPGGPVILNEHDLVHALAEPGEGDAASVPCREPAWVGEGEPLERAAAVMRDRATRRLLVRGEGCGLAGIVVLCDVARGVREEFERPLCEAILDICVREAEAERVSRRSPR